MIPPVVKRKEIVKMFEERLRKLAPELSAQAAQSVVELVESTGLQLFFTTTNGRAVQRLIRNYLIETDQMPLLPARPQAPRSVGARAACVAWKLPENYRAKIQFAKQVLEVLATPDKCLLEKIDADLAHVDSALAALQNVLGSSHTVTSAIEELTDARESLVAQRNSLLENRPWILRAVPNGSVPVSGQPQKKARREDLDDDDEEEDDEELDS